MRRSRIAVGLGAVLVAVLGGVAAWMMVDLGGERRVAAIAGQGSAVRFSLHADGGKHLAGLRSWSGCAARGEVLGTPPEPDGVVRKHLGQLKYEPCVLMMDVGADVELLDWIRDVLNQTSQPRSFWLVTRDYQGDEIEAIHIVDALLTRFTLPNLDGGLNGPALLELELHPDSLQRDASPSNFPEASQQPKSALAHNFRLTLAGGNLGPAGIVRVSSLEATQPAGQVAPNDLPQPGGPLQVGDLQVTVNSSNAEPWRQWFEQFAIQGNSGPNAELTGTLELLSNDLVQVLLRIDLDGVGIYSLNRLVSASEDSVAREKVSLYVEEMELVLAPGSSTTTTTTATTTAATTTTATTTAATTTQATTTAATTTAATTTTTTTTAPAPTETTLAAPVVKAATAKGGVQLIWEAVKGALGYAVLSSTAPGGPYTTTAEVKEASLLVTGLKTGATYYFVVRSVGEKAQSADSKEVSAAAG